MKDLLIPFVAATIICIAIFWGSRKIECKSILMLWWIGIFLISLVMENWHFLLVYLPQRSEYRQTTAVVYWEHLGSGYSRIRHKKSSIDVRFEVNETLQYGKSLPYAFNEHEGDKIQIAYREYNGEILDVSRSTIIVDGRMVMALFGLFWACVMCLLRPDDRGS